MQTLDKLNILKKINKTFFTTEDLKKSFNLKKESLKKTLGRLVKRKLLKKISRGIYVMAGQRADFKKIASQLYAPYAYISFESALSAYGIMSQIPYTITMATWKTTKTIPFFESEIALRKIKKELFFGYSLKDEAFIAEPEKALLDTLYLKSKGLISLNEEELNLGDLSKKKFLKMSQKFPPNVQNKAKRLAKKIKNP